MAHTVMDSCGLGKNPPAHHPQMSVSRSGWSKTRTLTEGLGGSPFAIFPLAANERNDVSGVPRPPD